MSDDRDRDGDGEDGPRPALASRVRLIIFLSAAAWGLVFIVLADKAGLAG